jgi:hypothetical protein
MRNPAREAKEIGLTYLIELHRFVSLSRDEQREGKWRAEAAHQTISRTSAQK